MKLSFALNIIFGISFFIMILIYLFKHNEDKNISKIMKSYLVLGFAFLINSIFAFLWMFNIIEYSVSDFSILFLLIIFVEVCVLFRVMYIFSKNKKIIYFLFAFLLIILLIFFSGLNFFILSTLLFFVMILLLFIRFVFRDDSYRKVGYSGILYSIICLIFAILVFTNIIDFYFLDVISSGLFLFVSYLLFSDLRHYPIVIKPHHEEPKSYLMAIFGHLVFVVTFISFIFIGTIAIHEFGHYSVAKIQNCEYGKIVFEDNNFHTEVICSENVNNFKVILGGVLLPILIALLLFSVGGKFMKEIGVLMVGFNAIAISRDLADLNLSEGIVILSVLVGIVFLIFGIFLLVKTRSEENVYF